jgi:hypothetical protein
MTHHRTHEHLTPAGPGKPTHLLETAGANGRDGDLALHEHIGLNAYQKWEAAGRPIGDGVRFWLEAEQELVEGKKARFVEGDGRRGYRELESREAEENFKAGNASVDSHYQDNNRMFQSHDDRGHRHDGRRD